MSNLIMMWLLIVAFSINMGSTKLFAQEARENIEQADNYLKSRTSSLNKYVKRSKTIQDRLLRRLGRKEQKMLIKLAAKDSALYYRYVQQSGISYDSIALLSNDTSYRNRFSLQNNGTIDSLKGVQNFMQNQQRKLNAVSGLTDLPNTNTNLSSIQQELNIQQNVDRILQKKTQSLKSFASQHANIEGLEGIQKDVYYAREKIKNWRALADEPADAEEAALEYLQGTEGLNKFLQPKNTAFGGLGNKATAEDLQRMGYQTKASVNGMLQKSLGNNLDAVQQQMGKQVQGYADQLNGISQKVKEVKGGIQKAKEGLQSAKDAKDNLATIADPGFKVNAEKGKPFWQRIEWQYNFQTSRASIDGLRPAMMDIGLSLGYKQNERLSFGFGIATTIGLGQNWQHVRLTYEGISARVNADWLWVYGFSFQSGYERAFRPEGRPYLNENIDKQINSHTVPSAEPSNTLKNIFGGQQQTAYAGVMKRYKINSKWNGTFLAGYNFLWQQGMARSPWMLRFGWQK